MITVFVCEEDAIKLVRRDAAMLETQYQLARAQSAIDENLAVIGCDERTVSPAPAAEHRQAEHGSQINRVALGFANGNQ